MTARRRFCHQPAARGAMQTAQLGRGNSSYQVASASVNDKFEIIKRIFDLVG
jgi:hypothetical protein